ncbi:MAG TPA: mechanosensitive ion channel family protein [Vicinamibacterales bacterium]|nr:mechanosensitive ion channel family protein [Vicinamibacterales bacterium]
MPEFLNRLPPWAVHAVWTGVTLVTAYILGQFLRLIVAAKLAKVAGRTEGEWDDVVIREIKKRVTLWSLLLGAHLSLNQWALTYDTLELSRRVISALGVASVTFALAAILTQLVVLKGQRASPPVPVSGLTTTLVRIVITLLGALVIVRSFGHDITPYLTALGVGGFAVALALQDPLSNLFAGIFNSIAGQVRMGDYVRLDSGVEGHVVDFNWRSTRLKAAAGNLILVPNAKLAQAIVTNFTMPASDLGFAVEFTVSVGSDLAKVERVAMEVAQAAVRDVPGAMKDAPPLVRFTAFAETGVRVAVIVRALSFTDQFALKSELIKRLQARLQQESVDLATMLTGTVSRP